MSDTQHGMETGRNQSEEHRQASRMEQEAGAASMLAVDRDFTAKNAGVGAGLVGHDSHLNGGVQDASRGAVLDTARDGAVERTGADAGHSDIEQSAIKALSRRGVDANDTNPTMQHDAFKDAGRQLEADRYDQVRQQGGDGKPDQKPETIATAKSQPAMEHVVGGLDGATQEAFAGIVKSLGSVMKGEQPAGRAASATNGRDMGGQGQQNGPSHFGDGGKAMAATAAASAPAKRESAVMGR